MIRLFLFILSILMSLTSCFKTTEDILREKKVDQMHVQVQQSSKIIANLTGEVNDLKSRLANTTGQLEEIDHLQKEMSQNQKKTLEEYVSQLDAQVKLLIQETKSQKHDIELLKSELKTQKSYTKKVIKNLSKINNSQTSFENANKLFEKNKLDQAQAMYEELLAGRKVNNAQKNMIRYNLGLIHYWNKSFDDASAYFSQIYTKWPKSSYAPKSLLYIARSFSKQKKVKEAQAAYKLLIKQYPKKKSAKKAQKELSKL